MNSAKKIRLGKIIRRPSKRTIIVPIDHGLTMGPIPGLAAVRQMGRFLSNPNVDAVIAHKGIIERLADQDLLGGKAVILQVNGMTSLSTTADDKTVLTGIETAHHLGVDAISLQVNFTGQNDRRNLRMLGRVVDEAYAAGLPVLTMLYDKIQTPDSTRHIQRQRQLLRTVIELGSDLIKIGFDPHLDEILPDLAEDAKILVAGGSVAPTSHLMNQILESLALGAAGVCVGRNVFASSDPNAFLNLTAELVHGPEQSGRAMVHAL